MLLTVDQVLQSNSTSRDFVKETVGQIYGLVCCNINIMFLTGSDETGHLSQNMMFSLS